MVTDADIEEIKRDVKRIVGFIEALSLTHLGSTGIQLPDSEPTGISRDRAVHVLSGLTTKQHMALLMLVNGKTNTEIADRMAITVNTAKVHVRTLQKKFDTRNRSQTAMHGAALIRAVSDEEYESCAGVAKTWAAEG